MKKVKLLFLIIPISLLITASTQLTPKMITEKASDAISFDAMEMTATLKIIDKSGNSRIRQITNVTQKFKETTKTRMRFLAPADVAGTTVLIHDHDKKDDDMWIYMPSLKNTRRVLASDKGKSFMGSEFTNADMSRPNPDDYNYVNKGTTTINNKKCWIIEATFVKKSLESINGFKRKLTYIDQSNFLTYKVEYFGADGKLGRTVTYSDYRKQTGGKYFSFTMEAANHKNNRKSIITVNNFKAGINTKESFFDPSQIAS